MRTETLIFLGLLLLALVYAVMLYNGLVQLKNDVAKAWANIDVVLKQRHDELPKLVEVCKQYKQFEQGTLQAVIEAGEGGRADGERAERGGAEGRDVVDAQA